MPRRASRLHPFDKTMRLLGRITKAHRFKPFYDVMLRFMYPNGMVWQIDEVTKIRLTPKIRALSEDFEPIYHILVNEARPGDIVVDAGASIGLYALTIASRVADNGRVFAFEPDPWSFSLLKENVELNGVKDQVIPINAAVGRKTGKAVFVSGMGAYSHVKYREEISSSKNKSKTIVVECIALDTFFSDSGHLDIMKIDVEGYEEEVLIGAKRLLSKETSRPRLISVELHPWTWQSLGLETSVESILRFLNEIGYVVYDPHLRRITDSKVDSLWLLARPE